MHGSAISTYLTVTLAKTTALKDRTLVEIAR
jgi:hypothetical protein